MTLLDYIKLPSFDDSESNNPMVQEIIKLFTSNEIFSSSFYIFNMHSHLSITYVFNYWYFVFKMYVLLQTEIFNENKSLNIHVIIIVEDIFYKYYLFQVQIDKVNKTIKEYSCLYAQHVNV